MASPIAANAADPWQNAYSNRNEASQQRDNITHSAPTQIVNGITSAFGVRIIDDPNRNNRSIGQQTWDSFTGFGIRNIVTGGSLDRLCPKLSEQTHNFMFKSLNLKVLGEKEDWSKLCRDMERSRMGAWVGRHTEDSIKELMESAKKDPSLASKIPKLPDYSAASLAKSNFGWYLERAKDIRNGNFSTLLPSREAMGNYLKTGIIGNHTSRIAKFLGSGEGVLGAAGSIFYMGSTLYNVFSSASEASAKAEEKGEDGTSAGIKKGITELVTFVGSYEVGAIGFSHFGAVAACLAPTLVLPASLLGAALFGTLAKNGIRKLFKGLFGSDDEEESPAEA